MDSKEGSKKKGISQDLLLDDFFKPPAEEEPVESKKKEPEPKPKPKEKTSIKKDLFLDDFFSPPATEEPLKEAPPQEVKKEKEPEISTTYKQVKKAPPSPVVEKTPEPPPVPPPPQRSLKELLEEPIFETKKEPAVTTPYKSPTPQPGMTPKPIVITPAPGAAEGKKFPLLPLIGGIALVIIVGVGAFLLFSGRGKEKVPAVEKPKTSVVEVPIQKPEVEAPVQKPQEEQKIAETAPEPEAGVKVQIPEGEKPAPVAKPEEVVKKPEPKPVEPKPVAKVNRFVVTVGPFKTKDEAKAQEIKVKILGYTPKLAQATQTVEVYNLFIDPPVPEAEANVIRLKMSIKGFNAELVDANGNKRVKLGSYSSITEAIEKKNQAAESGYTVTIDIGKTSEKVFNLEIGFPENDTAQDAVEKLKGLGIEARIIEKKV
jgi:cell division protein FtsN